MTKDSICWATGGSGSVSESSALEGPFFLFWGRAGCSTAAGVSVRKTGAWPVRSVGLDPAFGLVRGGAALEQEVTHEKGRTSLPDV